MFLCFKLCLILNKLMNTTALDLDMNNSVGSSDYANYEAAYLIVKKYRSRILYKCLRGKLQCYE